jgi:hypothetical protein
VIGNQVFLLVEYLATIGCRENHQILHLGKERKQGAMKASTGNAKEITSLMSLANKRKEGRGNLSLPMRQNGSIHITKKHAFVCLHTQPPEDLLQYAQ